MKKYISLASFAAFSLLFASSAVANFDVATYNVNFSRTPIFKEPDKFGYCTFSSRFPALKKCIADHKLDALCIQEAVELEGKEDSVRQIKKAYSKEYHISIF
jgi:hypothetical protein